MSRPDLTPAEFNVLKALWRLGDASVADVRAQLGERGAQVAYTTVMTLLGRLVAKGAVAVDRSREPFLYRASAGRESVLRDRLRAFVRDVFDGDARAVVLGLAADGATSADELAALEAKVAAAEAPRARASKRRSR